MRKRQLFLLLPLLLVVLFIGFFFVSVILSDDNIPSTLKECYAELDLTLSDEEIDQIRNAGSGDLFRKSGLTDDRWNQLVAEGFDPVDLDLSSAHFGLGLWIRNNWIYPSPNTNIAIRFLVSGVNHPDDMSSMVVDGYYLYLNDLPYSIPIQAQAIVTYIVVVLILVSSISFFIVSKHRK